MSSLFPPLKQLRLILKFRLDYLLARVFFTHFIAQIECNLLGFDKDLGTPVYLIIRVLGYYHVDYGVLRSSRVL